MKRSPRASRFVLLAWFLACFVLSAVSSLPVLGGGFLVVGLLFPRQATRAALRAGLTALPVTLAISATTWAYASFLAHTPPDVHAYAALILRATLIAFASFAVLGAVDLLGALAPWPIPSRLLVLTLAQIHALRLLVRESWLGLQSRLPRKPAAIDGLRNAGGVTATLFTLTSRNAREISEALRSRGF